MPNRSDQGGIYAGNTLVGTEGPRNRELAAELRWCNEACKVKSDAAGARRQMMRGASHRQGNCSHAQWKKKMIIQTQLNTPIPPLVLPSQSGLSHQGTSGGLGVGPAETGAATATEVGEGEVAANGGHIT